MTAICKLSTIRHRLTLIERDLWQVSSGFLVPFVIEEFDSDAVSSRFPIQIISGFLKVSQDGDGTVKAGQFIFGDRTETTVFQRAVKTM